MQLGETIATYDLGQALRGESGKFEVTSPIGEIYHVTCKANHSISSLECASDRSDPQPFLIRKVTEIVSANQGNGTVGGMIEGGMPDAGMKAGSASSPFLIEDEGDAAEPARADSVVVLAKASANGFGNSKTAMLDLFYTESEASSPQPSVWVCVKNDQDRAMNADKLITARCDNFNELDAEIRKLQAQLEEIRSRAKKKFYSAYAAAAIA